MLNMQKQPMPANDRQPNREIVDRVLAGDKDVFADVYKVHFRRVYGFILKRVRNSAEAEDLTQETFVQLYRSLAAYEGRSSLLTWILGIANNVCSRYFRHCSRWMVGPHQARPLDDRPTEAMIESSIDAGRVLDRCGEVLEESCCPAHQQIFHMRYAESRSIRSIAERLGKSNAAVKVSLLHSRTVLAEGVPELSVVMENFSRSARSRACELSSLPSSQASTQ